MKKFKKIASLVCIVMGMVGIFAIVFSSSVGGKMGSDFGTAVGIGVGSFKGVVTFQDAYEEAKNEELQVKDTQVTIGTGLDGEGEKLQVLVAKTTVKNVLEKVNETFKWDYKKLEQLCFEVVFTVDLSKARVSDGSVFIPEPEISLYNDESARQVIAEYNNLPFGGSAEDGFDMSMNAMKEIMKNSKESLTNYDELLSQAKDAAKIQVADLYRSLSTDGKKVEVTFFANDPEEE